MLNNPIPPAADEIVLSEGDVGLVTQAIADAQFGGQFNGLEWPEAWAHFEDLARAALTALATRTPSPDPTEILDRKDRIMGRQAREIAALREACQSVVASLSGRVHSRDALSAIDACARALLAQSEGEGE